jgi:hypothetical protein
MVAVIDRRVPRKEVHVGDEDETMILRRIFELPSPTPRQQGGKSFCLIGRSAECPTAALLLCHDATDMAISDMNICTSSTRRCCCRFYIILPANA